MVGNHRRVPILAVALVLLTSGCDGRDDRLTRLAELQGRQNQDMSAASREVASGSRQLVEAQAASTDKLLAMQGEMQRQQHELDLERRSLAGERQRESLFVPLVSGLSAVLLALLPLFVCVRLLRQLHDEPAEAELNGLLLDEFLAAGSSQPALPATSEPAALPTPSGSEPTADEGDDR